MAGITDIGPGPGLPSYYPAGGVTQAPPAVAPQAAQPAQAGALDYIEAGLGAGAIGVPAVRAAIPAAKAVGAGLVSLAAKNPRIAAGAGITGAALLAAPIGRVIGGALGGEYESLTNPNSPLRQGITADNQAVHDAPAYLKLPYALGGVGHAVVNNFKGIGMGVQAAFEPDAASAPAVTSAAPAPAQALGHPDHPAAPYMQMPSDAFAAHVGGLNRRDALALLQVMPQMKMAPHDQAMSVINSQLDAKYASDKSLADAEKDPQKRVIAQQTAYQNYMANKERVNYPGAAVFNPLITGTGQ